MSHTPPDALPPLLVRPHYVAKPWGGRRLETLLGREGLPEGPVGESWEVGTIESWDAVIDGGPHDGAALRDVWGSPFPLLVKVLDAAEDLSVQVHPDGLGGDPAKEEAWAALGAVGAVAVGTVDPAALPAPGAWLSHLERRALAKGAGADAPPSLVHAPPGTVHAILAGAFVWEVQTPVNVTWRLDDHGRLGLDGKPRALHLDAASALLARGSEPAGRLSGDACRLEGRRLRLLAVPPGVRTGLDGALVAFFVEGGVVEWTPPDRLSSRFDVPRGRTVILPQMPRVVRSEGWTLAAGVPSGSA